MTTNPDERTIARRAVILGLLACFVAFKAEARAYGCCGWATRRNRLRRLVPLPPKAPVSPVPRANQSIIWPVLGAIAAIGSVAAAQIFVILHEGEQ